MVDDAQTAAGRRTVPQHRQVGFDVARRQVHDHTLPHPSRRARLVVTSGGQRRIERVVLEVDRNEANIARYGCQLFDALTLFALRIRMIDLEYRDVAELGHPPRPTVEPRAQNHDLGQARGNDRVVDGDGARHHHHGLGLQVFAA